MTRNRWSFISAAVVAIAVAVAPDASYAQAKTTKIRVQSVIPTSADEVTMLKEFAADVTALTGGSVTFEVLPAGAVVAVNDTLDAVDKGLIEAGFAWTHYWSGKHPAAALFGSPAAGAGVGMDNFAWVSWFLYGGGSQLYDQLWKEMKVNVKGFILQPVGPEALGWFKNPINSMADFRKLRFRTPPGIPGQIYNDIGVASVAMGGGDILPGLEKGVIDAAEWCCPKPDMTFGFHKVLKHYYLEGLHQVVVNADLYINGDVWRKLTPLQQKAIEVSANASLMKTVAYRIHENGIALKELTEKHGVILHDTPPEYFKEYGAAALKNFEKNAATQSVLQEGVGQPESVGRYRDSVLGARAESKRGDGRRLRGRAGEEEAGGSSAAAPAAAPAAPAKK